MYEPIDKPALEAVTVSELCRRFPCFSKSGIRMLLFRRHENGLARAVLTVGRKILIDVDEFVRWLDTHREAKP